MSSNSQEATLNRSKGNSNGSRSREKGDESREGIRVGKRGKTQCKDKNSTQGGTIFITLNVQGPEHSQNKHTVSENNQHMCTVYHSIQLCFRQECVSEWIQSWLRKLHVLPGLNQLCILVILQICFLVRPTSIGFKKIQDARESEGNNPPQATAYEHIYHGMAMIDGQTSKIARCGWTMAKTNNRDLFFWKITIIAYFIPEFLPIKKWKGGINMFKCPHPLKQNHGSIITVLCCWHVALVPFLHGNWQSTNLVQVIRSSRYHRMSTSKTQKNVKQTRHKKPRDLIQKQGEPKNPKDKPDTRKPIFNVRLLLRVHFVIWVTISTWEPKRTSNGNLPPSLSRIRLSRIQLIRPLFFSNRHHTLKNRQNTQK